MCRSGRVQSGLCLPSRVRVQLSNNGRVRVVHLRHFSGLHGFGSHFQIKYGSGSVPCAIFTGLFGFGYKFLDPWRPLIETDSCQLINDSCTTTLSHQNEKKKRNQTYWHSTRSRLHNAMSALKAILSPRKAGIKQ